VYPEATRRTLAFGTGVLALALAAAPALRDRRLLLRASVAVVAGALAVSIYALVARLVFGNKLYGIWAVPTVAPFGPFVNKNHFAGYVELAALLALGLASGLASEARRGRDWLSWIESRRARAVVLAFGSALVLVLAVAVSQSRGGVVSLAAGLAAFLALRLWPRRERRSPARLVLGAVATTALLAVALWSVLPEDSRGRIQSLAGVASEESGSFRLSVWRDSLRLIQSSPWLGSGLGAFEDAFRRFKTSAGHLAVQHAESDHVELLAESGALGFGFAATAIGMVCARALAALRGREALQRALVTSALAGTGTLTVHSAIDFNLHIPSNAMIAGTLAAVMLGCSGPDGGSRSPFWRARAALTLLALVIVLLTPTARAHGHAGGLTRAANAQPSSLRRSQLESDVVAGLRRSPATAHAWLGLAWLRLAQSHGEAVALSRWATVLDPASDSVKQSAASVERARSD
jgi:O-antigen ligase